MFTAINGVSAYQIQHSLQPWTQVFSYHSAGPNPVPSKKFLKDEWKNGQMD